MSYLPAGIVQDTVLPRAWSLDLRLHLRTMAERYRRHYPCINYFVLKKAITSVRAGVAVPSPDIVNNIMGEAGTTYFDEVYRESVPQAISPATGWQQAHGTSATDAAEPELYELPRPLHVRFFREAKQTQITKWGFDKFRDVVLTVPLILLDEIGVVVKEGDKFQYDQETYLVSEANTTGYWKNTSQSLYAVLNCVHRRFGS